MVEEYAAEIFRLERCRICSKRLTEKCKRIGSFLAGVTYQDLQIIKIIFNNSPNLKSAYRRGQMLVMDREAWRAAIHGVTKSRT